MDGVLRLREPVVCVLGLTRHLHEAGPAQVREVARHERLGEVQKLDEIAHAQFSGRKEIHHSQAGGIREPIEQGLEVGDNRGSNHSSHGFDMRVDTYNMRTRIHSGSRMRWFQDLGTVASRFDKRRR